MKKIKNFIIPVFVSLMLVAPVVSSARLVTCDAGTECDFGKLFLMINNTITFILKDIAVPIAAVMFFYAGILLITAGGGEGKTKAKNIFMNTLLGLCAIAGCWLIIKTLLSIVGGEWSWIGF